MNTIEKTKLRNLLQLSSAYQFNVFSSTGYHHCTKEEASVLGALIYRVKYGESKTELANLTQMLRELIPTDLVIAVFCTFLPNHFKSEVPYQCCFMNSNKLLYEFQ
jgi:hypothetical protein